jgi:WD40 repeat protein
MRLPRFRIQVVVAVCAAAAVTAAGAPSQAAFPGRNGLITVGGYEGVAVQGPGQHRLHTLVNSGTADGVIGRAEWSRDGKKLLVSGESTVYVADSSGRRLKTYPIIRDADAAAATWSRFGGAIVYRIASKYCDGALVEYRFSDHTRTQITPCDGASVPAWSPTLDLIAYRSDHGLMLLDARTGAISTVTAHARSGPPLVGTYASGSVSWSPDGRELAYSNDDERTIEAYDLKSGSIRTVVRGDPNGDPRAQLGSVAWSPDGRFLAYTYEWFQYGTSQSEGLAIAGVADGKVRESWDIDIVGIDWQPLKP